MGLVRIGLFLFWFVGTGQIANSAELLFQDQQFTNDDSVYVVDQSGKAVYQWQADKALIPASLTKLATTFLALDKWGTEHRFETDIYKLGDQLWIKGRGDPYLISEEIDRLVEELIRLGISSENTHSLWLDNHYFKSEPVPGRSGVADPYNAPLSAIAANFNTVQLRKLKGAVQSAEMQTPLTPTAVKLAGGIGSKAQRVNLRTTDNSQRHFAEILAQKLGLIKMGQKGIDIHINQRLPVDASLLYRHYNSRILEDYLRATLEYSNNFIANQVYLKLAETADTKQLSFSLANDYANRRLGKIFGWQQASVFDGSGLYRSNRLSAIQIDQVLSKLQPNKELLSPVMSKIKQVKIYAKTGTLDGVRSYAGFIELPQQSYRFVFIFNRQVDYRYRDRLLRKLVQQLVARL